MSDETHSGVSDETHSGPGATPDVDPFSLLAAGFFPTHAPRPTGAEPQAGLASAIDRCCEATASSEATALLAQPPIETEPAEIGNPSSYAAGFPAIASTFRVALPRLGVRDTMRVFLAVNQREGFDCQSCAWPNPDGERHRFEFCESGAKAMADEGSVHRYRRRVLPRVVDRRARRPAGPLAQLARPAHRAAAEARGLRQLRADRMGRGLSAHRRRAAGPLLAEQGGVLHVGAYEQRGGISLPALRPPVRHQQPARLLQHVPRVVRDRARRESRHRQGQRHAERLRAVRPDRHRRPESRDQPPADADDAPARQAETARRSSPSIRWPSRGSSGSSIRTPRISEPDQLRRPPSGWARRSPISTCRYGSTAISPCSRGS